MRPLTIRRQWHREYSTRRIILSYSSHLWRVLLALDRLLNIVYRLVVGSIRVLDGDRHCSHRDLHRDLLLLFNHIVLAFSAQWIVVNT